VPALLLEGAGRLLTLTGPPGIGKTRLALQAAGSLLDQFPDGIYFVPLAALAEPTGLLPLIAGTLGVYEEPGRPLEETLAAHLSSRRMLLVLDNFEHLVPGALRLAPLRAAAPDLYLLVTSRERLLLFGEVCYVVPPLTVPDPTAGEGPEQLAQYEAVALFVGRARAAGGLFPLTRQNAAAVAQLCVRLDGLPLALELAAARSAMLPPAALLAQLDQRLALLAGGAQDLPTRQQTLRGAIAWSYDLLPPPLQELFRRLGVFQGSAPLAAISAVVDLDAPSDFAGRPPFVHGKPKPELLDQLAALGDRSLLQLDWTATEPRYTMLETLHDYALEQLAASGELAASQARHAAVYAALAEEGAQHLTGPDQAAWLDRLAAEHANLRAALAWLATEAPPEAGLRLATALWLFWRSRGYAREGRAWLARLLARAGAPPAVRAAALNAAGWLAYHQDDLPAARAAWESALGESTAAGDRRTQADALHGLGRNAMIEGGPAHLLYRQSFQLYQEVQDLHGADEVRYAMGQLAWYEGDLATAIALYEEVLICRRARGDKRGKAATLLSLGNLELDKGNETAARTYYEESLELFEQLGDERGTAILLHCLGNAALYRGDYGTASKLCENALVHAHNLGDRGSMANAFMVLGDVARLQGDYPQAGARYAESLALHRTLGLTYGTAWALYKSGAVAEQRGDTARARSLAIESLALFHRRMLKGGIAHALTLLAVLAAKSQTPELAARLFGAATALLTAINQQLEPPDQAVAIQARAMAQAQLDPVTWATALSAGAALPLDAAVTEALINTAYGAATEGNSMEGMVAGVARRTSQ
jgi:predicted ATPase